MFSTVLVFNLLYQKAMKLHEFLIRFCLQTLILHSSVGAFLSLPLVAALVRYHSQHALGSDCGRLVFKNYYTWMAAKLSSTSCKL